MRNSPDLTQEEVLRPPHLVRVVTQLGDKLWGPAGS